MREVGGTILQAQHLSVNDGAGIRTILFFAGCPLRCQWCANPEGFTPAPKVGFFQENCIGCGLCARACPQDIGIDLNAEREKCIGCGACASVCPAHARKMLTEYRTASQLIDDVRRQLIFFRESGGGVTFSGGEATMQQELLRETAVRLHDMGVSLAIETSGHFHFDSLRDVLLLMDQIFVDIKHMDPDKHREYTGVDNRCILRNIEEMGRMKLPVTVRVPTILGVNADEENLASTADFVRRALPGSPIELLPYHTLGSYKYQALGMPQPPGRFRAPDDAQLRAFRDLIESRGVQTIETK